MEGLEAKLFMGWFERGINAVDWFLCPVKSPMGLELAKAQFTDIYQGPFLVGVDLWRFTAKLEWFKLPIISEAKLTDRTHGHWRHECVAAQPVAALVHEVLARCDLTVRSTDHFSIV